MAAKHRLFHLTWCWKHGADPVDLVEKNGETPLQASLRIGLATGGSRQPLVFHL